MKNFLTILVLFFICSRQLSAAPLSVSKSSDGISLGPHLSFFFDESKSKTLDEVRSLQFTPSSRDIPSFGPIDAAVWIKFSLSNHSQDTIPRFLEYRYGPAKSVALFQSHESAPHTLITTQKRHHHYITVIAGMPTVGRQKVLTTSHLHAQFDPGCRFTKGFRR